MRICACTVHLDEPRAWIMHAGGGKINTNTYVHMSCHIIAIFANGIRISIFIKHIKASIDRIMHHHSVIHLIGARGLHSSTAAGDFCLSVNWKMNGFENT